MIKLTVNPDSQKPPYCFDKTVVIIGSGPISQADLAIPGLQPSHLKIEELEGRFVITNLANDPFVSLNGLPFAKKTIKNGDVIQIGEVSIRFECAQGSPHRELWVQTEEQLHEVLEKALTSKAAHSHSNYRPCEETLEAEEIDIERELEHLAELGHLEEEDDLEDLLRRLATEKEDHTSAQIQSKQPEEKKDPSLPVNRPSLKDFYLSEFDDESEKKSEPSRSFSYEGMSWNWKLISTFISALLILAMLLALFFYFSMKVKNRDDEFKVAEGLSDISMALTYAQFNRIQPRNQNWTDPEFLKNNLISVLASEYSPITSLDMQGLFNNTNYILRIYNSSDLSHYVIIAQPAPSLSQWVLPRAALVVDSKAMELRKMKDLKALNRLMLNPNPLDGSGTSEVSLLIKQGELIPLAKLAAKTHRPGFNAPKALALLRPGAENLIYNAPRYYRFGEQFLKKAMGVAATGNSDEINMLQEEIETFSKYPDIVLYASQGMQWTVRAQKMLNSLMPTNKLLLAYLKLNSSGYVASSHLLMDEGRPAFALREEPVEEPVAAEPVRMADLYGSYTGASIVDSTPVEPDPTTQTESPLPADTINDSLLQQLRELSLARERSLREVEQELLVLLVDQDREEALAILNRMEQLLIKHRDQYLNQPEKLRKQTAAVQFIGKFHQLVARYDTLVRDQRDDLVATLTRLYQENPSLSYDRFMDYAKEAGL